MLYNKLDETAEGVYIISATPFKDSGELDLESTKKLVDFYLEKGVDGITVLGVMGEAPKLTIEESKLFLDTVLKQVATFNKIVEEYDQVVMFKHEEWPGLNKLSKLRKHSDNGATRRVSVLTGNGGLFLPQEMQRGADGAMTGFAYPEMLVEVIKLHKQGRIDEAEDLFDIYLPYVR